MGNRENSSRRNRAWRRTNHIAKDLRTPKYASRISDTYKKKKNQLREEDYEEVHVKTYSGDE